MLFKECWIINVAAAFEPCLMRINLHVYVLVKITLSGTLSECQTVWNQIRTDALSVLICVQTVCKGYRQITKVNNAVKDLNIMKGRTLSAGSNFVMFKFNMIHVYQKSVNILSIFCSTMQYSVLFISLFLWSRHFFPITVVTLIIRTLYKD